MTKKQSSIISIVLILTTILSFSTLSLAIVYAPAKPTLYPIYPNQSSSGIISLRWSIPPVDSLHSPATYYKIYCNDVLVTETSATSYVYTTGNNGIYNFKIRAYNSVGYSGFSNVQLVTVNIPIPLPSTPVLNAISPAISADGIVKLKWSISSGATSYKIYRSLNAGTYALWKTITTTTYTDTIALNGNYSYYVVASNSLDNSGNSNVQSVEVKILTLPPDPVVEPTTPILYTIVPNPNTDGIVSLRWSISENAVTYGIYRSIDNGISFKLLNQTNSNSFTVNTVNGFYLFGIVAFNNVGRSNCSNVEAITVVINYIIPPTPPPMPPPIPPTPPAPPAPPEVPPEVPPITNSIEFWITLFVILTSIVIASIVVVKIVVPRLKRKTLKTKS